MLPLRTNKNRSRKQPKISKKKKHTVPKTVNVLIVVGLSSFHPRFADKCGWQSKDLAQSQNLISKRLYFYDLFGL